ncbi:ChbG/HpnK family deacetylase [Candidatus Sumerlaeota bacterium]|nr:ChbG/HpnK family deacetylase [Candidatus Sumerlaeota bacterium]
MRTLLLSLLAVPILACAVQEAEDRYAMDIPEDAEQIDLYGDGKIRMVIRVDDVGMNHAVNTAFRRIAETGCVSAASVMVISPWLDEAVEILREHPEISVGVHTCFNSEWVPYRWGPVLPAEDVPSLVDERGHFFGTRAQLREHGVDLEEFEAELRAQVDLALACGLNLSYIDHHMSAAVDTEEMRAIFEQVARDYGLGVSRAYGERGGLSIYSASPEAKADTLLAQIAELEEPGIYLSVHHPGLDVPEMAVLRDLNVTGLPDMHIHRQAETDALCDPRLPALLEERGIEIVGYDDLSDRFGVRVWYPH